MASSYSSDSISTRISRLEGLLNDDIHTSAITKDSLIDTLLLLYEECNNQCMIKSNPYIASFIDKYTTTVAELKKLRICYKDFEIIKVIGRGHFGEVQVVCEKHTQDVYAMKVLRKTDTLARQNVAFYEEERDIMALASSPWITQLQYAFQDADHLYLVMQYHPGGDLLSLLGRHDDTFEEAMACFYLAEIVLAIHDLHDMGYVHRDIKPENVLISCSGHIKLADFGSACRIMDTNAVKKDLPVANMPVGTPDYICPELLSRMDGSTECDSIGPVSVECDWWSLGICAYEMLYGHTPFTDENSSMVVTYANIMNHKKCLQFPKNEADSFAVSDNAQLLIKQLLTDAHVRLQYQEIRKHAFFTEIKFDNIQNMDPPFMPIVRGCDDTSNFEDFERMRSQPYLDGESGGKKVTFSGKDLPFIGFTYTKYKNASTKKNSKSKLSIEQTSMERRLSSKARQLQESESLSAQLRCTESKLQSEVSVLRTQCDDYRRRCERVETERNQLERDRAHYVTEVHSLKRQLALLTRERDSEVEETSEHLTEMLRKQEELTANEIQLKEDEFLELLTKEENRTLRMKQALKSEKQKYQNSKETIKEQQRKIKKLERELKDSQSSGSKSVEDLRREFHRREKELSDKIEKINHSKFMLEEQLTALHSDTERLSGELNSQQKKTAENSSTRRELAESKERCDTLSQREKNLKKQLHEKSHAVTELQHTIQELEDELDTKNFELQKHERLSKIKESQYSNQIQDLEETIVSVRDEHQQFEESTIETIELSKQQKYTLDKKENEVSSLTSKVNQLTEQIARLQHQILDTPTRQGHSSHTTVHNITTPSYTRVHTHSTPTTNTPLKRETLKQWKGQRSPNKDIDCSVSSECRHTCKASPVKVNIRFALNGKNISANQDSTSDDTVSDTMESATDTATDTSCLSDDFDTSVSSVQSRLDSTDYLVGVNRYDEPDSLTAANLSKLQDISHMEQASILGHGDTLNEAVCDSPGIKYSDAVFDSPTDKFNQSVQTSRMEADLSRSEFDAVHAECLDLRKECEELQILTNELRSELRLQKESTDQQRIRALDLKYELKEKVTSYDAQVSTLRTAMNEAEINISELEQTNKSITDRDEGLRNKLQTTQQKLDEAVIEHRSKLTSIQTERDDLKSDVLQLSSKMKQYSQLEHDLQKAQSKCSELLPKNKELEDRLRLSLSEKNTFRTQYERALESERESSMGVQKLEQTVAQLKSLCSVMDGQLQDYESVNKDLTEQQKLWNEEKVAFEQSVSDKDTEITDASQQLSREKLSRQRLEDELLRQKTKLEQTQERMSSDLLSLRNELSAERKTVKKLNSQLSGIEQKHSTLEMDHKATNYQLDSSVQENNKLKEELSEMKTLNSELKSLCNALNQRLESALYRGQEAKQHSTQLEDRIDSIQSYHTENRYLMESTLGQHAKLIDYLQTQVENPNKKKKGLFGNKKVDTQVAQGARIRSVYIELDQERERNIHLRQQIANLRDELHQTRVEATRLQNKLDEKSPMSTRVIRPAGSLSTDDHGSHYTDAKNRLTPHVERKTKGNSEVPNVDKKTLKTLTVSPSYQKSAQHTGIRSHSPLPEASSERMHHNIPHRFLTGLNSKPTTCHVCLGSVQFVKQAAKCQECGVICHPKCAPSLPATCGLPSEYAELFSSIVSQAKAVSSSELASVADLKLQMKGWMKTPRSNKNVWERRWIVLKDNTLQMYDSEDSTVVLQSLDLCPPDATVSIHSAVTAAELINTASSDLAYIIRLELTPDVTCWPGKSLYLMALSFPCKQKWVATLSAILSHNKPEQAKLVSNKIVDASGANKLEVNCILPLSEQLALVGADEGLFVMTLKAQARSRPLLKVAGVTCVHYMMLIEELDSVAMITGRERRLVLAPKSTMEAFVHGAAILTQNLSIELASVAQNTTACSTFCWSATAQGMFLVAALAEKILVFKYDVMTKDFETVQELLTSQPCSCMLFGRRQILIGTDKFYSINLVNFTMTEFLDRHDSSLAFAAFGAAQYDSFPITVLRVSPADEAEEFLLCLHEFGVFVDSNGRRTRDDDMKWSGLPLYFSFEDPYLYIVYFNHLQIILLEPQHRNNIIRDKTQVTLPMVRYVGPALTSGAIYVASLTQERTQVICVKGNMEGSTLKDSDRSSDSYDNKENIADQTKYRNTPSSDFSTDTDETEIAQIETYEHSPGSRTPGRARESALRQKNTDSESVRSKASSYESIKVPSSKASSGSIDMGGVKGRSVAERAKQFQSSGSESEQKTYRTSTVLQMSTKQS